MEMADTSCQQKFLLCMIMQTYENLSVHPRPKVHRVADRRCLKESLRTAKLTTLLLRGEVASQQQGPEYSNLCSPMVDEALDSEFWTKRAP